MIEHKMSFYVMDIETETSFSLILKNLAEGGLFMLKTIDELFPDWKEKVYREPDINDNLIEMLPIFQQLVKDRNYEAIQAFYNNIFTYGYDMNDDRDRYFHDFIMTFCNMENLPCIKNKKEPKTKKNYLCFKIVGNRGEENEFSFFAFFEKQELSLLDYKFKSFLMYNNLTGLETYLYTYEFDKPEFKEENETQCNNLVLCFKLKGTENENILKNKTYFGGDAYFLVCNELEKYGLTIRNTLLNGEDLIVVVDLYRTMNLKCKNLKYTLKQVEKELLNRFKNLHIYDNKGFFMIPGSINSCYKTNEKHNFYTYKTKVIENNDLVQKESNYYRCYFSGEEFFYSPSADFSKIASLVGIEKYQPKKNMVVENKKRYTKVGEQRLEDLDTLMELRNGEIDDTFDFFRIMANTLFYLEKNASETFLYMNEKNDMLYKPISYEKLFNIFKFCKEDYEKYLINTKNGIKYTNERIVELLNVNRYEMKEMKQFIGAKEAKLRERNRSREKSKKNYAPIKEKNAEKRQKQAEELLVLRDNGLTNREIAEKMQMDIRKVDRLIGKDNKKQELEKKIKEMLSENKTVKEICNILNASESKVRRIKKNWEEEKEIERQEAEEEARLRANLHKGDPLLQALHLADLREFERNKEARKQKKKRTRKKRKIVSNDDNLNASYSSCKTHMASF